MNPRGPFTWTFSVTLRTEVRENNDKICTHNLTLGRVPVTVVGMEKQFLFYILSVFLYPKVFSMESACAVSYCLVLPHFPHYPINGTTFEKKIIEYKTCVWIFSTPFV